MQNAVSRHRDWAVDGRVRENDTRQQFVSIRNENRGSYVSALFHHGESLNGDAFNVANVGGTTKPAWMKLRHAMHDQAVHSS